MVERLLLDGVDVGGDDLAVDEGHQPAVPVLADGANAPLSRLDDAAVGAKTAGDGAFLAPCPRDMASWIIAS